MSAASNPPANATTQAGLSSPLPPATRQGAGVGETRIVEMNGSRLLMKLTSRGWVNQVIGTAPFLRSF
jgi:hypothetical protein